MKTDSFIYAFLATDPEAFALAPLVLTRDEDLRERAPRLWRTIQEAPVEPPVRAALSQILEYWLFERFKAISRRKRTCLATEWSVAVPPFSKGG